MESPEIRCAGEVQRDRVCISEIWAECFGRDLGQGGSLKRQDAGELRAIMRQMPGWAENPKKQWCGPYGSQRCFERIAEV